MNQPLKKEACQNEKINMDVLNWPNQNIIYMNGGKKKDTYLLSIPFEILINFVWVLTKVNGTN